MRLKVNKLKDRLGEERVISLFLFFPKKLQDEWRWMERAYIKQSVQKMDVGGSMDWGNYRNKWVDLSWEELP